MSFARVGLLAWALVGVPVVAVGSEEGHGEGEGSHSPRDHKNEVALFLGGTDESGHDTQFTWGLDYKRRIAKRWAAGGWFDYAGGDLRNAVAGGIVAYWPGLGDLQLLAGPAVEFHEGRGGGGHGEEGGEPDKDAAYFLFRIGVGYDIHIGEHYGIVPVVMLDFVDNEEVWVYGLAFTYGW